ncbi:aldo/keto reductase [Nocardia fluminea]|uniref:aldo/keto reductase n=1 Tax=Nocardia fluminea TaxID=134984 RepID=UPI00364DC445
MRYRLLGRTGLRVSELFLGAMAFGHREGLTGIDEARRIVDLYGDAGGNVIDTADKYDSGGSEDIVGGVLAGRRDRFVLATKYTRSRDTTDPNASGSHRKNLTLALEASLRRLRTDYIDLYWVHVWDPFTPIEETVRALDDAVRAGKILHIGISDAPAWVVARANTLAEGHDWTPFSCVQVPYNVLTRDIEREMLPMAESLGIGVATWRTLHRGVLAGRAREPLDEREQAVVTVLGQIAELVGASRAQVAIAWARARSHAIHPLIGVSRHDQLGELLGAVDITLSPESVAALDSVSGYQAGFLAEFIDTAGRQTLGEHFDSPVGPDRYRYA